MTWYWVGTASPAGFWCWHMPGGLFPPLVWVRTSNQSEANYHRSQGGESLSRNLQPIGLPHHPAYLCHSPQADVFLSPQQTGQDCGNLYKAGQAQQQQHLTSSRFQNLACPPVSPLPENNRWLPPPSPPPQMNNGEKKRQSELAHVMPGT